jgi:hypothetical protein
MTSSREKGGANRFVVHPNVETHFSWLRTRMSTERTLTSRLRTAVALIGFTIVQFFERFNKTEGVTPVAYRAAPRYLGLMLIGTHRRWQSQFSYSSSGFSRSSRRSCVSSGVGGTTSCLREARICIERMSHRSAWGGSDGRDRDAGW